MGFRQHRPHGALDQVPGRLNRVEDPGLEGALDRLSLVRAGDGQADRQAGLAQSPQLLEHGAIVEDVALERRRVDLVEGEVRAEQVSAFGELPPERRHRQVLHLVPLGIHPPPGRVGVAPLRADRHRPGR
jgi:hypothetical protein